MHDTTQYGQKFRSFNVIDDFNREALNITLDVGLTSRRVIRELDKLTEWRGKPERMRVDNGPELLSGALHRWCEERGITLKFIEKGKPSQNGYVERFNRSYRTEVLDNYMFESLDQARLLSSSWMWIYNNDRPHKSLGYKSPVQFMLKYGHLKEMPTLQHDDNHNNHWKSLILNTPNLG